MRLLDQVAQCAEPIKVVQDDGRLVLLPGANAIAAKLKACPLRFVLDDEVASVCAEIAFSPDSLVNSCLDIVRSASPMLWVEYDHAARHPVFLRHGLAHPRAARRQRIGVLIECSDESLRAGTAHMVWESLEGLSPELCPVSIDFDFDNPALAAPADLFGARPHIRQLQDLFARTRPRFDPMWLDYYRAACADGRRLSSVLQRNMMLAMGDFPIAVSLLLMSMAGQAFRQRDVDHSRLNAARARSGRPALLNHVELAMALFASGASQRAGGAGARHAPRLHHVRGHLVRRENRVFWRSPHLRGDPGRGAVKSRTVAVRLR